VSIIDRTPLLRERRFLLLHVAAKNDDRGFRNFIPRVGCGRDLRVRYRPVGIGVPIFFMAMPLILGGSECQLGHRTSEVLSGGVTGTEADRNGMRLIVVAVDEEQCPLSVGTQNGVRCDRI